MLALARDPVTLVSVLVTVAIAITAHEFAHAWRADRAGDPTPRASGRLTLNPAAHFDLVGSLLFVIVGFGWAKPVPINPANFRRPRHDSIMVSLWGPASNLLLGLASGLLFRALAPTGTYGLLALLSVFTRLNINLAVFNLIPLPPLDGSHILAGLLPPRGAYKFEMWGRRYGMFALLIVIFVGLEYVYPYVLVPLYRLFLGL